MHANVAVEELGWVVIVAGRLGLAVGVAVIVVRLGFGNGRGDLGDCALELGDQLGQVLVGRVVQGDARVGEAVDHGLDNVFACAVDEGGETAKDVKRVEEAVDRH